MNQAAANPGGRPPGTPRPRARQLGDRIAQIVAEMLERRIKDPRLGFVTVTEARVTGDLREATVYYTVYGSPEDEAGTAAALASATGLIRSEVGKQTGIKHTPSITFVEDTVPDTARNIEDLVAKARQADAEVAAVRADAVHAGDADPYRQPASRADEDDDEDEYDDNDLIDDQFDDDDLDDDDLDAEGAVPGPLGNYPGRATRGGRSAGQ
jgi:ribosome-binding factor A